MSYVNGMYMPKFHIPTYLISQEHGIASIRHQEVRTCIALPSFSSLITFSFFLF